MKRINFSEIIGKKFNQLTIISYAEKRKDQNYLLVRCDCGLEKIMMWENIRSGKSKSCGCLSYRVMFGRRHPLYKRWLQMKARCYNKKFKHYNNYGGRGVTVCNEWRNDFESFFNWAIEAGWKEGLELDKDIIPKRLGIPAIIYSPEMCCWVTHTENMRETRRVKLNMEKAREIRESTLSVKELAEKYKVHTMAIYNIKWGNRWKE